MIQSPMQVPNMPMQQLPQQGGGANAVAINIYNPQAYGTVPTQVANTPYQVPQPVYQIPYAPMYSDNAMTNPMAYQQFMPVNNVLNAPNQMSEPQFIAPAPQAMPPSVIDAQVAQAPVAPVAEAVAPVAPIEVQQPAQVVDVDTLVQNLKSTDANVRGEAINQIAGYAQEAPEVALQIVSEPIMQALVDIINEDTTGLEGPTAEQKAVSEKIMKGEQLTAQEEAIAQQQTSPLEIANHNRAISIYTLAMIQKLQREELNQYIETQKANGQEPIAPLNIQDLIGYNEMVNVIKTEADDNVKLAAIEGLGHIVEPQDQASVEALLNEAQKSSNPDIQNAATDALAKFAA
ncbi:MAG: hypothetical protein IJB79_07760 [Candidatus Gastranaerophilales bacterium]|nr:hypothetical protein [Candidatus Gastranaerophilales bacterium]